MSAGAALCFQGNREMSIFHVSHKELKPVSETSFGAEGIM